MDHNAWYKSLAGNPLISSIYLLGATEFYLSCEHHRAGARLFNGSRANRPSVTDSVWKSGRCYDEKTSAVVDFKLFAVFSMAYPLKRRLSTCVRVSRIRIIWSVSLIPLCGEAAETITSIDLQYESLLILIPALHSAARIHLKAAGRACSSSQVLIKWNSWRRGEKYRLTSGDHAHCVSQQH